MIVATYLPQTAKGKFLIHYNKILQTYNIKQQDIYITFEVLTC